MIMSQGGRPGVAGPAGSMPPPSHTTPQGYGGPPPPGAGPSPMGGPNPSQPGAGQVPYSVAPVRGLSPDDEELSAGAGRLTCLRLGMRWGGRR
jgi:hypothetical protein